jgi:hypothetical protein
MKYMPALNSGRVHQCQPQILKMGNLVGIEAELDVQYRVIVLSFHLVEQFSQTSLSLCLDLEVNLSALENQMPVKSVMESTLVCFEWSSTPTRFKDNSFA